MRRALFTTLKAIALVAVYVVVFGFGSAFFVGESAGTVTPAEAQGQAVTLVLVAAIDVALLALLASRSRLHGWRLALILAGAFYFVKTFTSMIEAWYFMKNIEPAMLPGLFLMTVPVSLVVPPLVAWAFGPRHDTAPVWHGPAMSLTERATKIAVLSALVYPALFLAFGYFVAWRNEAVRAFYGTPVDLGFFGQLASIARDDPRFFAFEALRGLGWVACAIVLLRTTRGHPWVGGALVALFFALVQNDVHLLANPLMPGEVRFMHFWETTLSNALNAAVITWWMTTATRPRRAVLAL